ncbi:MAG: hypothetical protein JNK81_11450 [Anaerolineales bacterium]|nr:hypothetical protein [Anaerolineales bacterium]
MQRVTLSQFVQNTTVYERTPININPGLRRGVWITWLLDSVIGVFYAFLPRGSYLQSNLFFQWTNDWMINSWDFVAEYRQFFIAACALVFCINLGLLITTRAFNQAEIALHIALFVPVIFVSINLLFVMVLLLPVIANLIIWLCLAAACIVVVIIILLNFVRARSQ